MQVGFNHILKLKFHNFRTCPNFVFDGEKTQLKVLKKCFCLFIALAMGIQKCEIRFLKCDFVARRINFGQVLKLYIYLLINKQSKLIF